MGLSKVLSGNSKDYSSVNPDPKNYKILDLGTNGKYTFARIRYYNCTTYSGIKLLVFEGNSMKKLLNAEEIDPHFFPESDLIARFAPSHAVKMRELFNFMPDNTFIWTC
jgi:hypothetical protein